VYTSFEPRVGLAWNPDFDKKLVIRAGYAINANPAFYNMFVLVADGAPVTNLGRSSVEVMLACLLTVPFWLRTTARSTCPHCIQAAIQVETSRTPSQAP